MARDHGGHSGPSVPVGMGPETSLAELRTFFRTMRGEGRAPNTPRKSGDSPPDFGIFWISFFRIGWRPGDTARWIGGVGSVVCVRFALFFVAFLHCGQIAFMFNFAKKTSDVSLPPTSTQGPFVS